MRCVIVGVLLYVATVPAFAEDGGVQPHVPSGTAYGVARAMMMRQGFEIVKVDPRDDGGTRCSIGREEVCDAYPETRYCSGSGRARCEFMFTRREKRGGLYAIETQGEDIDPTVVRVRTLNDREISRFLAE